jgi:hypothetical protein
MTHPVSLPLTALIHSKQLLNWVKQKQQQQQQQGAAGAPGADVDPSDAVELMRYIQGVLQEAAAAGQLLEGR